MSGGHAGAAHPSPSEWIQYQQEEEGAVCCSVFDCLCFYSLFTLKYVVNTPAQLTVFYFHFQNVTQEFNEDLISLNEILEVGLMNYIISFDMCE